jgi:uncharacterized protein with von Willebrand factor type A (vWA) domain
VASLNRDDLFALFKIDDRPAAAPEAAPGVIAEVVGAEAGAGPPPPHAFEMDLWGERRGREVLAGEYQERLAGLDLGFDPAAREAAAADLHAAAFEPAPSLNATCADPVRHEFLSKLVETDDYAGIHAVTQFDAAMSELAAVKYAEGLHSLRQVRANPRPPKPGRKVDPAAEAAERECEAMAAAAGAAAGAAAEVSEARAAAAACGMGGGGALAGTANPKAVSALFRRVRNDPALRRICELAGRYRRLAQGKQKNRTSHGYDDMVGITTGGDVGKLVASELAALSVPGLADELALRLVENRAGVREHAGVEPVGKGPIVVTVDESGSMSGEKIHTAKALALALAWVARSQRRWCCLVGFSGGTQGTSVVLPPHKWNEDELCDWLTHFFGGGTDLDVPVKEVPAMWPRFVKAGMSRGKTDVIMITDAIVRLPKELEESFLKFKKAEQVRLIGLVVQSKPGDLAKIADELHAVPSLGVTEEAVGRVVSI